MKSNYMVLVVLVCLPQIISATALNHTIVKVVNRTDKPFAANLFYRSAEAHVTPPKPLRGVYGYPIQPKRTTKVDVPELYWFPKVAIGGLKRPGSQVRIQEVLNHARPNTFEIRTLDMPKKAFALTSGSHTVYIDQDKDGAITIELR